MGPISDDERWEWVGAEYTCRGGGMCSGCAHLLGNMVERTQSVRRPVGTVLRRLRVGMCVCVAPGGCKPGPALCTLLTSVPVRQAGYALAAGVVFNIANLLVTLA